MNRQIIFLISLFIMLIGVITYRVYIYNTENQIDDKVKTETTTDTVKIETTTSCEAFPFTKDSLLKKYAFPLSVNVFIESMGMPQHTIVDEHETCPIGQIHTWCLQDKNLEILALGDHYKSQIDYTAGCRLYALKKCNADTASVFDGLWDIKLGDTDESVKGKLDKIVDENPFLQLTQDRVHTRVHEYLVKQDWKHHYVLSQKDCFLSHYIFFLFGNSGNLEVIIYTTMDIRVAC